MRYKHPEPVRLLEHYDIEGPFSLGFNHALNVAMQNDPTTRPVLRLHRFSKPMLSVGSDKRKIWQQFDRPKLKEDGVELIARPSPGSPVLNCDQELCITFITRKEHWDNFSMKGLWKEFNEVLVDALGDVGIPCHIGAVEFVDQPSALDNYEVITDSGHKIFGTGLLAKMNLYSQEGVLPLTPNFRTVHKYLIDESKHKYEVFCVRDNPKIPTSIIEELGEVPPFYDLTGAIIKRFVDRWPLKGDDFTPKEVLAARKARESIFNDRA